MSDSIFNIIFIIAIMGIFVARKIAEAKKKKAAPPKPKAAPKIQPLHFEVDEEEEAPQHIKTPEAQGKAGSKLAAVINTIAASRGASAPDAARTAKKQKKQAPASAQTMSTTLFPEGDGLLSAGAARSSPVMGNVRTGTASSGQGGFALNLNHLSPMKQAVVMAEILGQPKGLSPTGMA